MSGIAATLARRRLALGRSLPALTPRLKRRAVALAAVCLALAGGYQFWLRDSSLVAVDEVKISGLTTSDAPRVRGALDAAAKDMTTLHVDHEQLERAVESYPVVRALEVTPEFPHGLRVRVIEHVPAAMAVSDAGQVAVAGDGTILRGMPVEGELPTVEVEGVLGGDRLRDTEARAAASVAGAAPAVLRRRVESISRRPEQGLVAELSDGPELIFGSAAQLRTKWAAAARVLADPEAEGASYIDLRIAGRPAAGGLPAQTVTPVAPAGTAPPQVDPLTGAAPADPSAAAAPVDANAAPVDPNAAPVDPNAAPVDPNAPTTAAPETPGATTATPPTTVPPTTPAPAPAGGVEGGVTAPGVP